VPGGQPGGELVTGGGVLRDRAETRQRVTYLEMFFDLVYVFAVTQLSLLLLEHLSVRGALQTLLVLLAIWRAWIDTAWVTNWFNPGRLGVRLVLVAVMLLSLVMSAALPEAFGGRGLIFAGAYVTVQVGRGLFTVLALRHEPGLHRNFQRITAWAGASGLLWLAGGLARGPARDLLWLAAAALDYAGPAAGFRAPGLGRSQISDWTIIGGHLAERCHLFLMIALGESVLVIGATFGSQGITVARTGAFVVAFLGSVTLWWVYFDRAAEQGSDVIARSSDPGRLGRSAYTYFHLPMVAGIIAAAVGDELTIAHPEGTGAAVVGTVLGGPALFLAGHVLFKRAVFGRLSAARLVAIAALAVLVPVGLVVPPVVLAGAATLVVATVAVSDARAAAR
jgi:low temperature requirement protein LtrA